MIVYPNCKINLGLKVVRKRPDGYHDLETVFYPIPLCDKLEAVVGSGTDGTCSLAISGNPVDGELTRSDCSTDCASCISIQPRCIAMLPDWVPTAPSLLHQYHLLPPE